MWDAETRMTPWGATGRSKLNSASADTLPHDDFVLTALSVNRGRHP